MALQIPDRSGWVTGPLAELPPIPPFPAFTDLEARALAEIAAQPSEDATALGSQIASAVVIDRINTGVGFYTRVAIDRSAAKPLKAPPRPGGGHCEIEGFQHGLTFLLWFSDGFLDTIEGAAIGDDLDTTTMDLAALKLISMYLSP